MQSAGIHIPIDAINNASPVIRQVAADVNGLEQSAGQASNSASELSGNVVSLNAAMDVASRVAGVVKDAYQEIVGTTVDYANNVREVRDVTGQTAQESSRLIQFMDDYKISTESMSVATKKLAKEDLPMNIETLAMLSDEFLGLDEGVERTTFLYEKFGKQGDRFAEVMLLGKDAILRKNDAISDNLILTDESLRQSREYEMQLDTLNDSWMALKITLGNEVIPVANEVLEGINNTNEIREKANELLKEGIAGNREEALSLAETSLELNEVSAARWNGLASMYETITATEDLAGVTSTMAIADEEAVKGAIKVQEIYEKHAEKLSDLQLDHEELLLKKQELIDQGWWPESEKIQDVNEKLAENEKKQQDVTAVMKGTLDQMLLNTAAAGMDAEAQLALARATGQIDEASYAALSAQQVLKGEYDAGMLTAQQYADKTMALREAIARLESKKVTITVDAILNEIRNSYQNAVGSYYSNLNYGGGRASGGPVGAGKMYEVNEQGIPELLNFSGRQFLMMPNTGSGVIAPLSGEASAGMGGGGAGQQIVFAPVIQNLFGSQSDMVNTLYPAFLQMLEMSKADGYSNG